MEKVTFGSRLKYFSIFVPFRLYLVLFALGIWIATWFIGLQPSNINSSFSDVLHLLVKVLLWFGAIILSLSLLSVLVPYIIFLVKKKTGHDAVTIETASKEMVGTTKQLVKMNISPLLQPLFGFLNYRLVYDENKLSPKFTPINASKKLQFFNTTKENLYHWPLPEIKEYSIDKVVIYFEDIFQFFSLSTTVKTKDSFFTKPVKKDLQEMNLSPKKTEEQTTRIEELRRVEGEYLNYKNFEDNDDVRRIVWKIYAKNKELVVRMPEVLDPFASHLYLYASYNDGLGVGNNTIIAQRGLNYFKTAIWGAYNRLKQQGFDVRFIPDQATKLHNADSEETKTEYIISTSTWQNEKKLKEYVNVKDASVVCISSLTPAVDLTEMLDILSNDTSIIFVKLSNSFNKQGIIKWVRWLFLQEEKEADNRNLMQWNLSAAKRKMMQNEKAIGDILKGGDKKVVVL